MVDLNVKGLLVRRPRRDARTCCPLQRTVPRRVADLVNISSVARTRGAQRQRCLQRHQARRRRVQRVAAPGGDASPRARSRSSSQGPSPPSWPRTTGRWCRSRSRSGSARWSGWRPRTSRRPSSSSSPGRGACRQRGADPAHRAGGLTPSGNSGCARCVETTPRSARRRSVIPSFQQQVDRLVTLGYPALAGLDEDQLRHLVEPLRPAAEAIEGLTEDGSPSPGALRARAHPRAGRARVDGPVAAPGRPKGPGSTTGTGRPQPRRGRPGQLPPGRGLRAAWCGVPPRRRRARRGVLQRHAGGRHRDHPVSRPDAR